jgi:F-type H+-transporting ATPase subunit b
MQSIGGQLGELFLQAVPTVLIILLFYIILRVIFFKPLLKVMAERDARTAGAQKAAQAAQAAAHEKVKQYQEALRHANAKVYAEQEAARKNVLDERGERLKEARAKANAEVTAAKAHIEQELTTARREVEATVGQLAAEIAQKILQAPPSPRGRGGSSAREAR